MNKDEELIKNIIMMNFMIKVILKKVYDLSDKQFERVIKAFELDSEKAAIQYLDGVKDRNEFKKWFQDNGLM